MMKSRTMLGLMVLSLLSGCGGSNPLDIFGDPANFPQLSLPGGFTSVGGTITANNGLPLIGIAGQSVTAPGEGVIVGEGNGLITILHTTRLQTQVNFLGTTAIKLGDKVKESSVIGTFGTGGSITFKVFVDNNPVCPTSFLNASARTNIPITACI